MAVDYEAIKASLTTSVASNMASATAGAMAELGLIGEGIDATWNGSSTVLTPDTSRIAIGNSIKVNSDGKWYRVTDIDTDVSIQVEDTYQQGGPPSGGAPTTVSATLTWDRTAVVQASSVAEFEVGESIRLDSDGRWFTIAQIESGELTISTNGQDIPTGTGACSKAGSSFITVQLPGLPDTDKIETQVGAPLVEPIVDDGIKFVQNQPHELPHYTVAEANAISGPLAGSLIWVTNQSGGATVAVYDGSDWRVISSGAVIST